MISLRHAQYRMLQKSFEAKWVGGEEAAQWCCQNLKFFQQNGHRLLAAKKLIQRKPRKRKAMADEGTSKRPKLCLVID